jgi:hypothetical protein
MYGGTEAGRTELVRRGRRSGKRLAAHASVTEATSAVDLFAVDLFAVDLFA